ncbi:hypothetical protein D046_8142B, partial [Vibrio parahaemolyticus V-223/04]
CKSRHT